MADLSDPAGDLYNVTPSDSEPLPWLTSAIYISVAGTIQVTDQKGVKVALPSLGAGWHPIRVSKIWATNTTATGIVAVKQ